MKAYLSSIVTTKWIRTRKEGQKKNKKKDRWRPISLPAMCVSEVRWRRKKIKNKNANIEEKSKDHGWLCVWSEPKRKENKNKKVSTEEEEKERVRFWNQVESRDKKGEDGDIWVYACGGEKTREKRRRKHMDERKEKNRKWPFKNTTTIFSQ